MDFPNDMGPRTYLRWKHFSPEQAHKSFPNAHRLTLGGLFISHAGVDSRRIQNEIITPVVFKRLPSDGYFLHSSKSGGATRYGDLVQAALHWCDKFMVVISEASIANLWVQAEVEWAIERSRPILAVSLDGRGWLELISALKPSSNQNASQFVPCFDFSNHLQQAQSQFSMALDKLLEKFPRKLDFDN